MATLNIPTAVAPTVVAIRLSSATRYRPQPPLEYAILVNGGEHMWVPERRIFQTPRNSPILRIGLLAASLAVATGCNKLGLGGSPTAPSGPPAAGSTIVY